MKKLRLISSALTAALILVALIALLEKGPPQIYLFSEASTTNPGSLGTMYLTMLLREKYSVSAIFNLNNSFIQYSEVCVYVIISPSKAYSYEEGRYIADMLSKSCRRYSLLVADERTTSNSVLAAVGSSIRVVGDIVYDERGGFYPRALIFAGNKSFDLVLDIASRVEGGTPAGYTYRVTDATVLATANVIAAYERLGENIVYVIGDGSIFLNQVVTSNITTYREFVLSLFDYLCFYNSKCFIVFDDSHRLGEDIFKLSKNDIVRYASLSPFYLVYLVSMIIARLLHPSTWFPPLVEILNRLASSVLASTPYQPLVLLILVLVVYVVVSKRFPREPDARLAEQVEREYFVTAEIRHAVLGGKVKLTKRDFVNLYTIVDSVLRDTRGVGLGDPRAAEVLRNVLGNAAAKFVRDMNRLYLKALGKSFLPIVISWNRVTRKKIYECEEVLKALGTTLLAEKGVEYVLARGVISV